MVRIAISKASGSEKYGKYIEWLRAAGDKVEVADLHNMPHAVAMEALADCDGLVLTGGPDVHPSMYGKEDRLADCHIDEARDEREKEYFTWAADKCMPVLAICRGHQVVNVLLGGTLIVDIPSDYYTDIEHRSVNGNDSQHSIVVEPGSLIRKITRQLEGSINSAHHQAVEFLPELLRKSAQSPDGIIEAFEWNDSSGRGFLLGVQWHPERMAYDSPFSLPIASHFLSEAEAYAMMVRR